MSEYDLSDWFYLLPELMQEDPEIWALLSDKPYPGPPNRSGAGAQGAAAAPAIALSDFSAQSAAALVADPDDDRLSAAEIEAGLVSVNALANDTALTGAAKTIKSFNGIALSGASATVATAWGSFTIQADGSLSYDLDQVAVADIGGLWFDEWIEEAVSYTAGDEDGNTSAGTITVRVGNVNSAPTATADFRNAAAGNALSANIRANDADFDALRFELLAGPSQGTVTFDAATGRYRYTPGFAASGTDTLNVRVLDPDGAAATTTVTFTVAPATLALADAVIEENSPEGLTFGAVRPSVDEDIVSLTYRLIDNAGGRFAIEADTGVISVANGSLLDYETAASHSITIGASDGTSEISSVFQINVTNDTSDDAPAYNLITGTANGETLNGTAAADKIEGFGGDDWLHGLAGDDYLLGGDGADRIFPGSGADIVDGGGNPAVTGRGNAGLGDYVLYATAPSAVSVDLSTGVGGGGDAAGDTYTGIENIGGSDYADVLTGSAAINYIFGQSGNDSLYGLGGDDDLRGDAGADTIYGGDGDDAIATEHYDFDADRIYGEAGNDYLVGGNTDSVDGGAGDDQIEIQGSNGAYLGGAGNDSINFYAANTSGNSVDGGDGWDYVALHANKPVTVLSLTNVEWIWAFGNAAQRSVLTAGSALLDLSASTYSNYLDLKVGVTTGGTLIAPSDTRSLDQRPYSELRLFGNAGDDYLVGSAWTDRLTGGLGNDSLDGGLGTDRAVFAGEQATYAIVTSGGSLQIVDNAASTDGNDGTDTLIGIETAEFKGGVTVNLATPIVLDLDGDGIELVDQAKSKAKFDLDGDGVRDKTGWIGKGDGILVIDRNGDGKVSGADEISFTGDKPGAKSDLDGLSAFDGNGDGRLDANDTQFGSFMVWRDDDGDGKVDKKELISLDKAKVAAIELAGQATEQSWAWGSNIVVNTGAFVRSDGSRGALADVALSYTGSRRDNGQAQRNLADLFAGGDPASPAPGRFAGAGSLDWDALRSNIGIAGIDDLSAAMPVTPGTDDAAFKVQRMVEAMAAFGPTGAASLRLADSLEDRREHWGIGNRYMQAA